MKKTKIKNKLTEEYVKRMVSEKGFELLEPYKGAIRPHLIYCQKHKEKHTTNLSNILYKAKPGLWCCRQAFFTGPSSPHYDKNKTDKDRLESKDKRGAIWKRIRKSVFELDSFTCFCCDKIGNRLNAHHIYNWASNENMRFDHNNLVSLCEICHKEFHSEYGYKNTTPLQLMVFKNKKNGKEWSIQREALELIEAYEDTKAIGKK